MKLEFGEFKKNPIMYILFLPLIAMVTLFFLMTKNNKAYLDDKNRQIEKQDRKLDKTDSINHGLYELLGAKKIIDTLK